MTHRNNIDEGPADELESLRQQFPELEFEDIIPTAGDPGSTGSGVIDELLSGAQQADPLSAEDIAAAELLNTLVQQGAGARGARPEDTFAAVGPSVVRGVAGAPGGLAGAPAEPFEQTRGAFSRAEPSIADRERVKALKSLGLPEEAASAMVAGFIGQEEVAGFAGVRQALASATALEEEPKIKREELGLRGREISLTEEETRAQRGERRTKFRQERRESLKQFGLQRRKIAALERDTDATFKKLDLEEQALEQRGDISEAERALERFKITSERRIKRDQLDLDRDKFDSDEELLAITSDPLIGGLRGIPRLRAVLERGTDVPVPNKRPTTTMGFGFPIVPGPVIERANFEERKFLKDIGKLTDDETDIFIDRATELGTTDLAIVLASFDEE